MSEQIIWRETEYKLKFVVDNPNFTFPQVVRVMQGYMVDDDDSLASGQILVIHGKTDSSIIVGHDSSNNEIKIPLSCPQLVRVLSCGGMRKFRSVREICCTDELPEFIQAVDELSTGGERYGAQSIFQINCVVETDTGGLMGLSCVHDRDQTDVMLPVALKCNFVECLSTQSKQKNSLLSTLVKEKQFPMQVQFLTTTDCNNEYGPHLGVLTLTKSVIENIIEATAVIDSSKHSLTFSSELPVTIQVARDKNAYKKIQLQCKEKVGEDDDNNEDDAENDDDSDQMTCYEFLNRYNSEESFSLHSIAQERFDYTPKGQVQLLDHPKIPQNIVKGNRSKSLEFGKSKLNLKGLKKSMSIFSKTKRETKREPNFSNGANSRYQLPFDCDVYSSKSDSYYNEQFHRLPSTIDALSLDVPSGRQVESSKDHFSQISSKDSGICSVGHEKLNDSFSRSISNGHSSNQSDRSDHTFDSSSQWSMLSHYRKSGVRAYSHSLPRNLNRKNKTDYTTTVQINHKGARRNKDNSVHLWSSEDNDAVEQTDLSKPNAHSVLIDQSLDDDNRVLLERLPRTSLVLPSIPKTSSHTNSINEIKKLNQQGVRHILDTLGLSHFQEAFLQNQINGELLVDLEEEDLVKELQLSLFQAKKIIKYIKGWRPESVSSAYLEDQSRRNSLNPRDWSEMDVMVHLDTINIPELSKFCRDNQVNGDLLLDILDKDTLDSIRIDHNVKISCIDAKKVMKFVVKGWRPDISTTATSQFQ